jgi:hypothetical protein
VKAFQQHCAELIADPEAIFAYKTAAAARAALAAIASRLAAFKMDLFF